MRPRTLCFEQITDDRFYDDIYNLLEARVKKLKELLNIEGVEVRTDDIYEVNFVKNKQYRCKFYVTKSTRKVTWNDIFKIVNSVNPVPYHFINN